MAHTPAAEQGQDGISLLEVVIAVSVLLAVLVPTGFVLTSSGTVLASNRSTTVAANLASGQLQQDRTTAVSQSALPAAATSTTVVDGVTYQVAQQVGWCAEADGTWGNYTSAPAGAVGYGVLVTVTWGAAAQPAAAAGLLTIPEDEQGAVPGASGSCPL